MGARTTRGGSTSELPQPEANQWAYAIDQAIKGERLTYVCETWGTACHGHDVVRGILKAIDLPFEAWREVAAACIRVGDGGIRFVTRRCQPEPNDYFWEGRDAHLC